MLQERTYSNIDLVRQKTDGALLFLSLGKDSLVLLDMIYPRFDRIVCVFMYFVKGLEHIESILRGGMYCVANPKIKLLKLADVVKAMQLKYGLYYTFLGMKKADGMNRRLMLKGYEANGYENNGLCYPLADYTQKEVLAYMRQHNLPQPIRYSLKASNGVGFSLDCFLWLRKNYPQDLERIYQVFPMSRRILFEYDNKQNNNG